MKPNPLALLKNLTVPVILMVRNLFPLRCCAWLAGDDEWAHALPRRLRIGKGLASGQRLTKK
jgi:hypothetical protein